VPHLSFDPTGILSHIDRIIYLLIALLISITVHEACHALSAVWLGDPTPQRQGRVTLNPLAHLDPVGAVMMVVMVISGFGLGWGKPVQINPYNMRINPKTGFALSSIAGPISNLTLATLSAILLGLIAGLQLRSGDNPAGLELLDYLIMVNVGLAIFNLIPIPPLDGFHTLLGVLPNGLAAQLMALEQYGFIILLAFIYLGLGKYLYIVAGPIIDLLMQVAVITARFVQ
jgi:Zn-dependent protease